MANNPCNIIRYDSEIGRLYDPTILLKIRSGKTLGNIIYDKESLNIKLSATDLDEISFDVYKCIDDKKNPVWDDLIDLRLIDVKGYGQFEISVDYSDKEQTIKTITAKSLETELGQLYLDEFHVNDDDATTMIMTDYNKDDFDADGNFIPTVFYNKDDQKHSLLDRVLADKAPHWSIGHVPEYIAVDKENEPELASKFQRIFTVDGTTIYDFLTGDIAKECNVIFTFDTYNRVINCYNLEDYTWVSEDGKRTITINAIGNDTGIFIDKRKLAKEITITSKSDEVKNALKVKAGDDVISDYVRAANLNGSNMIYDFAKFQLDDMPEGLVKCLEEYQKMMDADSNNYYGENGIYTRLAKLYDDLLYYQSGMMPDVHLNETTAKEQYDSVKTYLQTNLVAVYDIETYSSTSFQGITNNVEAMANVGIDSRYSFEIIKDSTSYDSNTHKWRGRYTITRRTDDTDTYSSPDNEFTIVTINDDNFSYTKQKIEKALSKTDMSTVDFDVANYTTDKQLYDYFNLYSQNRLKGFVEGYDSCISILASAVSTAKVTTNIVDLQKKYKQRYDQCNKVYEERKKQVEDIQSRIVTLQDEQSKFASEHNLKNWLDKTDSDYYRIFCMYIREDTYENSNYISDGLTDSECINKAKELLNTAQAELKKSCVLQRTISTSINNLLCMSEFEKLREDFCLFNYIRVGTDDDVFKLRLMDISFNASNPSGIDVTYSENIESVDGKTSNIKSILDQASSIASTYTYTSLQAKSGATANSVVTDMRNNGINAALMRLSNSDDNEVTYGREGIICKQVTDDGFYSDKATRITGSGMYITNDNWNTIKACIGETTDGNYGVIADTIVGKLIAGDQLMISNGNGSVKVTGDGIVLDGGSITWATPMDKSGVDGLEDNLKNLSKDINQNAQDFTKFKSDVEGCLGTTITSDAIISPKIGGGYLCISRKDGCTVIINPKGEEITSSIIDRSDTDIDADTSISDLSKYVFRVDDPKKTVLFGVTTDGDVNICNGGMTYSDGVCKIANFTISQNNMHTDNATFDNTEGIYFGSSGLRIGENFKISSDGTTMAKGKITITDGLYAINPISNTPVKMLSLSNMENVGTVYTDYSIYTKSDITGSKAIFSDGIQADYINPNNLIGSVNINGVNISRTGIDGYSKSDHVHDTLYAENKSDWISFDATNGRWAMYVNGGSYATFDGESFTAPQFKGKISNGTYYVTLNSNNNFIPSVDQIINCGTSGHSWKNIYSNGAKVTTSDARYKKIVCNISDDERYEVLFNNLKPKLYKYKNFKETDNHDRIHSGYISQEVKDAMSIAGIDNTEFAAFCYSNFENDQDAIDNNNGFKDKYMLGYEEFIALNTAMIQKLSKKIEKQQNELNELKEKIK